MKFSFNKYPVDILICIIWSILLLPLSLLELQSSLRVILGLPFILFIPGYLLVFALFPNKKTDRGIDTIERFALSFGLSIALVPLIGLGLNYTTWGIRLEPILFSIFILILSLATIGFYRWKKTDPKKRFIIDFDLSFPKSENKLDKALSIILVIVIVIALALLIYVIITPKTGEKFTEFYILGPNGIADGYPRNLTQGQNATVLLGVVNHEYKTIDYTIEIWLINQSLEKNQTTYYNMYYLDTINMTLNHVPINIDKEWRPQWEQKYNFSINKTGKYKLAFLLFNKKTEKYTEGKDYKEIAEQKINSAYRQLHLWLTIT